MQKMILLIVLLAFGSWGHAEETSEETFQKEIIDYKKVVLDIPQTSWRGLKTSFSRQAIPAWAAIFSSTAVLLHNDEVILKDVQRHGRDLGLGNEDKTKAILSAGDIDLLRLPTDTGSFLYFLGDGWMHFGIAGGFIYNGYSKKNSRAFNTGLQLFHGMAVSTMFNQFLKRSFGRESPYVRSEPFGKWAPYPSVKEYQSRTAYYDAMPSGHVMTTTVVFTIINGNYPEYSHYIIPTAVVWTSLLAWQMVNNGVHWASDYPLGLGMGYVFGKAALQLGKTDEQIESEKQSWHLLPTNHYGNQALTYIYEF